MPGETQEPEVTVDGLDQSLDDLIKAADATDLLKAGSVDQNRVEHSGTKGSDGAQGGGRGSYGSDATLDRMMIGKLADLGFDANQISAMEGALTGKATDEDEDEDDEEAEIGKLRAYMKDNGGSMKGYKGFGKSDTSGDGDGEPMVKSMDEFRQDPDVNDAIDVSPYLEAMTARTAEQIDAVNSQLAKGFGNQSTVNRAMAGALHQMGTLLKSQVAVNEELAKRLGIVERTPNPQKGVTDTSALNKSMPGEAGQGGGTPLNKSEILATLTYMNLEKGIKHIDGQPTSQAIGMLEGGNVAAPAVLKAVDDFHSANPTLSEVARQYH
jgi:hypothetical protein